MGPGEILQALQSELAKHGAIILDEYQDSERWTRGATRALVSAGKTLVPEGRAVAKGHPDDWDRSEYLNLDLVVLHADSWSRPLLIAEHENSPYADRVRYNAWKLLSVAADVRILVAYFGGRRELQTRADLEHVVGEVARDNPGLPIVLISADYRAVPQSVNQLLDGYHATEICVRE